MKIASHCDHLAQRYGYAKAFALFKEAGFDATNVTLNNMIHPESPFNQPGYQDYARKIRQMADDAGLVIHQTHAPFVYPLDQWELSDQHLLPLQGKINWIKVSEALGEIDYDGYFTYETEGNLRACDDIFLPVHLKYMADLAKHLGGLVDRNRP